jgi:hypothetical protein
MVSVIVKAKTVDKNGETDRNTGRQQKREAECGVA